MLGLCQQNLKNFNISVGKRGVKKKLQHMHFSHMYRCTDTYTHNTYRKKGKRYNKMSAGLSLDSGFKGDLWASLVAQWLRICLPIQRTRVRALAGEDPTCHGATKLVLHNY